MEKNTTKKRSAYHPGLFATAVLWGIGRQYVKTMLHIILLVFSCIAVTASVYGQTCPSCGPSPAPTPGQKENVAQSPESTKGRAPTPGRKEYVIDLANGTKTELTRYKTRDRIRIIIRNKNPFRYNYDIKIKEEAVKEPALAAFLKLLGPFVAESLPGESEINKAMDILAERERQIRPNCPEKAKEALKDLARHNIRLNEVKAKLIEDFQKKLTTPHQLSFPGN